MSIEDRNDYFKHFPFLKSERFYLKEVNYSLKSEFIKMMSDNENMKNSGMEVTNVKKQCDMYLKKVKNMYENKTGIRWSIIDKKTEKFLGEIGIYNIDFNSNNAEIGCSILKKYWRCGIASECISTVEEFFFNNLKMHKIMAKIDIKNTPSIKLIEKLHFYREGVLREHYFNNIEKRYVSIAIYSKIINN
ncbi:MULTISPECIES: GNAT family N-acetyltransferase [Clostridium]|uniref:GNAT family N-acetyltransferase n=1 Tax=Clostridium senegalense TaxID=1465809 RepID=A0A6M0H160_9CLOT|nr:MULTISPECIES: GNAT family N-acetyltransferase [Clostridium]NEU03894.1 GNAT family N-acetyltransferase [Clostridium senegalense]